MQAERAALPLQLHEGKRGGAHVGNGGAAVTPARGPEREFDSNSTKKLVRQSWNSESRLYS